MKARTGEPAALAVLLHGQRVGVLSRLAGDRHLFAFDESHVETADRPTLSLSFKSATGGLVTELRPERMQLPPFFANLLPEGPLRTYLAAKAGVKPGRAFALLSLLGADLPGAVTVAPMDEPGAADAESRRRQDRQAARPGLLKFSLAGVQLKFSALLDGRGRLTVPAEGVGGSWIVKLPSPRFPALAENEYAVMELARRIGIAVPELRLAALAEIGGLPADAERVEGRALAVRRFDRNPDGTRIHMEDFAQVFGIQPADKYGGRSYADIAAVLSAETGAAGATEFVRRLVFAVVTGNGDMHLKNWSLLYPDRRSPVLSPAYDLVSTVPYLPDDRLALTFGGRRGLDGIGREQIRRFADRAGLAVSPLWQIVDEVAARTVEAWRDHGPKDLLPAELRTAIGRQIERAALACAGRAGRP